MRRTGRGIVVLAAGFALVVLADAARAGSATGSLITAVDECQTHVYPGPNLGACTTPLTSYAVDQARVQEVSNEALLATSTANITEAGDLVAPLVGHALSLFASTVALRSGFSIDYANAKPTIFPTGLGAVSAMDTPTGFTYNNTAHLYWTPGQPSGRNNHLDGSINYNIYSQSSRYNPTFDFWSTTQSASVSPINGARLKEVQTKMQPNDYLESVESSPNAVNKYGSAGSFTLSATLSGEMKRGQYSGGTEIGVSRTWNFAEGTVGGGRLHDQSHYGLWQSGGKSGTSTAKEAAGVETWRVPINKDVFWYISGYAKCKSC
jgi:hypothetical protein